MINLLFMIALLATVFMAWRSYKQWGAYHRAAVTRVSMVNQVSLTVGLGVVTIVLFFLRGILRF